MTEPPHAGPLRDQTLDRLIPAVYEELCVIARRQLSRRGRGTFATSELVHEAYLKLADRTRPAWSDRSHFIALAALAMRHVMVDRARARMTARRSGDRCRVTLDEQLLPADDQAPILLELNDALERLANVEPRLARLIDCRFFGGFTEDEIAESFGITTRTVQRDWAKARMLLRRALAP